MAKAFEEQRQQPAVASLTFEERIGLLVDREAVERESRRLVTRLKFANLRQTATIEDLNTKAARGLDEAVECPYEAAAIRWAQALARHEANAGAVAFSRQGSPELGEFEDAVILKTFGDVPDDFHFT